MKTNYNKWIILQGRWIYNDKPFISFDGKRFETEEQCLQHEQHILNWGAIGIKC